jgi:anthranilate synthase/aminodeoxychorismate synthase-like glutamine amidotransferase
MVFRYPPGVILVIDNYDSFTYNLVQQIGGLGLRQEIKVVRNDAATLGEIASWSPGHIILSPGPCTPDDAGICVDLVRHFAGEIPLLGVCLGHQCIGQAFGARIVRAARLMHGKTSRIHHRGTGIYRGLPSPFVATRYHSLGIDRATLSDEFEVTSWTDRDELMGIRHKDLPIEGVQFHPESFLTEDGAGLISSFLQECSAKAELNSTST